MIPTRRGFLGALLAASAAPAIVRANSLMKLWVPPQTLLLRDAALHAHQAKIIELLTQSNEILSSMSWVPVLSPSHRPAAVRTQLPAAYWRALNV